MSHLRRLAAVAMTTAAFGAAACGDDEETDREQSPAPVNTDTPAQNESTTPAPEGSGNPEEGEDGAPQEDAGRGEGE